MREEPDINSLKSRFEKEIQTKMKVVQSESDLRTARSADYVSFKKTFQPKHLSMYEKVGNFCGKMLKLTPDKKKQPEIQKNLDMAHLSMSPTDVMSTALFVPLVFVILTVGVSLAFTSSLFLAMFFLIFGALGFGFFMALPKYLADNWRMKGSNQMILAVFYIVTYMRHTSNFERAVEFASAHLQPPMALDLKKVLWDVETGEYSEIFDSMEAYLDTWRGYNDEFIESMHLIQGSLLEEEEKRRLADLDKALDQILSRTYEKMLHYAHNLQSPITTLHMLGIILPILGLVILPLVVAFMEEARWYHIAFIYNVGLPIVVYVLGKNILSKRPTGYGASEIGDTKFKSGKNTPFLYAMFVFVVLFLIGFSPLWLHWIGVPDFGFGSEIDPDVSVCGREFCFFDYHVKFDADGEVLSSRGPYGLGAAVIGLFVPMSLSMAFALYFGLKTKGVLEKRNKAKKLEQEFSHALFALGNRLGDGIPAEMAFGKVGEGMPNTDSGNFCMLVAYNIQKLGMSVEQAIFDEKHGAIESYPSLLIESSMKVLTQSTKKGPAVASQALMNISRYLDEVHKVNERLSDLMGEVISSMKSQINFLTPIISGIVIGITSMISSILSRLSGTLTKLSSSTDTATAGVGPGSGLLSLFGDGVPTYFFQVIVGLYVVQLVYILTILVNGIENGVDPVYERWLLGKNMLKSVGLYLGISFAVMVLFNFIASSILSAI